MVQWFEDVAFLRRLGATTLIVTLLAQTNHEIVTLMTCWPPGTDLKRWIVQGERVADGVTQQS